jgi:hypothetical protein
MKLQAVFNLIGKSGGGPIVAPLQHKGFGRVILERVAPNTFDGKAELRTLPSGICWHLDAPIINVQNMV